MARTARALRNRITRFVSSSLLARSRRPNPRPIFSPCQRQCRLEPLEDRRVLSVLFVDSDARGGNGESWSSAFKDLQSALDRAVMRNADLVVTNDVDQIWIAEGTYHPTCELEPGNAQSATFALLNGVTLIGGFEGTETTLSDRRQTGCETILSGDLGTSDDNTDNAYTVVYCGENIEAGLEGVTIQAGNANGEFNTSHPERRNGGGIFNNRGTLHLQRTTLVGNTGSIGGGIFNYRGTITVDGSVLVGNRAVPYGGGIANNGGTLTVRASTLTANTASAWAGGIYTYGASAATFVNNTIAAKNTAPTSPDIHLLSGTLGGAHNLVGNGSEQTSFTHGSDGNLIGTADAPINPFFVRNPYPGADAAWGTSDDDYGNLHLIRLSPAVDAGENGLLPNDALDLDADGNTDESVPFDLGGDARIQDEVVDIGAYEIEMNLPPKAYSDKYITNVNEPIVAASSVWTPAGVLVNDYDANSDPLTAELVWDVHHGNLELHTDGTFVYEPEAGFRGTDTFVYRCSDGIAESEIAVVTIVVHSPVLYVDIDAEDFGTGGTWASAYNDLQRAFFEIDTVNSDDEPDNDISEIWVAEGVYIPFRNPLITNGGWTSREAFFSLPQRVLLRGGFAGTETTPEERASDLALHETILSGNVGEVENHSDNTYTVLYSGPNVDAELERLTITGGDATEPSDIPELPYTRRGGGIYNAGTLRISQSKITDNRAYGLNGHRSSGGGIYNSGTLTLSQSTVSENNAVYKHGGGICNDGGQVTVEDCLFYDNSAAYGGAIASDNSSSAAALTVRNSTFDDNFARDTVGWGRGAAICVWSGAMTITGSHFEKNTVWGYGGAIWNSSPEGTVSESTFRKNTASIQGGAITNCAWDSSAGLTIERSLFEANEVGLYNKEGYGGAVCTSGAYGETVTKIDESYFYRNESTRYGGAVANMETGVTTITGSTLSQNHASRSGGAIINSKATMDVINSTIDGNIASGWDTNAGGGIFNTTNSGETAGGVRIVNSTIVFNLAEEGGGIANAKSYSSFKVTLVNSIVAGNVADHGTDIDSFSSSLTGSHNLISDGSGQSTFVDGENGNIVGDYYDPADPCLSPRTQFANGLWGYHLLSGSPALDSGGRGAGD